MALTTTMAMTDSALLQMSWWVSLEGATTKQSHFRTPLRRTKQPPRPSGFRPPPEWQKKSGN